MMQHVIECCNTLSCDVLTVTVVACTFNDNCYIDGFGGHVMQMLDRYEQHTLKCASCRTALEGFRTWQKVFWGSTIILAAGAGVPPDLALRALLAVGSISSAALAYILKEKEKNFIFTDYNHSKID